MTTAGIKYNELSDKRYKKFALKAAKELGYSDEVIERIKNAESDFEVSRIMTTARKRSLD